MSGTARFRGIVGPDPGPYPVGLHRSWSRQRMRVQLGQRTMQLLYVISAAILGSDTARGSSTLSRGRRGATVAGPERAPRSRTVPGPPLYVRVPGEARAPFLTGPLLAHVPGVPGSGALSTPECRAHADGTLTALDGTTLWILPPSTGAWRSRRIPDGVQARRARGCSRTIPTSHCFVGMRAGDSAPPSATRYGAGTECQLREYRSIL
jgi:hypothetical protein